ncbi:MAG TPA: hypothetical protein VHW73_03630 [Rudaea sp.]|nr:hypothetical protein [Rudaea sp.]
MSTRSWVIGLCLLAPLSLPAQNVLKNSSFNTDAIGWATSQNTIWETAEDHHGNADDPAGGSLRISTSVVDFAEQCVTVSPLKEYVIDAWIETDPNPQFAPCTGANWSFEVVFWDDSECSANPLAFLAEAHTSGDAITDGWIEKTLIGQAPMTAGSAQVKLASTCSLRNGVATYYVDDITLQSDAIFASDFEVPPPVIHPQQPPTP